MIKRLLDVGVSAAGLVCLSPLLVAIAVLVRLQLGTPILFRQRRAGRGGVPFVMYKFRTMTDDRDADGSLLPDEERIRPIGRFLRATSLDELPELWNVLKGEMSLVGPRPLFVEYLPYYTAREARRHEVRPGLTGLAQVSGRNALKWEERLALDVDYVERRSFCGDLRILLATVIKVVRRSDVEVVTGGRCRLDDYRRAQCAGRHRAD